jgi:glucosyl-3-phosphoglycerate phosphatase
MTTLVLVRHGQTTWNRDGRFQGQADPGLDATGRRQARHAALRLSAAQPALIVSSDLRRAHQTAEHLARYCGLDVHRDPALREVDLGGWTGLTHAESARRFPHEYREWIAGRDIRRGDGESPREAGVRSSDAIRRWIRATPLDATLVVVSHGLVLRAALRRLAAERLVEAPDPAPHLRNGEWLRIAVTPTPSTTYPRSPAGSSAPHS